MTLASSNGLVRTNGIVLATTTTAHGFVPGQNVDIAGVAVASGLNFPYNFDGSFVIQTVPSTTTFTYFDPQKQNDTGTGGIATSVQAEQPAPPQASIAIEIVPRIASSPAPAIAFELMWTAAQGAFEVDIQESDTNIDANFITMSNASYTITTPTTGVPIRVDLVPTGGRFIRVKLVSRTNAVGLVVKATALA